MALMDILSMPRGVANRSPADQAMGLEYLQRMRAASGVQNPLPVQPAMSAGFPVRQYQDAPQVQPRIRPDLTGGGFPVQRFPVDGQAVSGGGLPVQKFPVDAPAITGGGFPVQQFPASSLADLQESPSGMRRKVVPGLPYQFPGIPPAGAAA